MGAGQTHLKLVRVCPKSLNDTKTLDFGGYPNGKVRQIAQNIQIRGHRPQLQKCVPQFLYPPLCELNVFSCGACAVSTGSHSGRVQRWRVSRFFSVA